MPRCLLRALELRILRLLASGDAPTAMQLAGHAFADDTHPLTHATRRERDSRQGRRHAHQRRKRETTRTAWGAVLSIALLAKLLSQRESRRYRCHPRVPQPPRVQGDAAPRNALLNGLDGAAMLVELDELLVTNRQLARHSTRKPILDRAQQQ